MRFLVAAVAIALSGCVIDVTPKLWQKCEKICDVDSKLQSIGCDSWSQHCRCRCISGEAYEFSYTRVRTD